ncbi:MAG TPA: AAA family ATPase [Polyangia bacterium]|jgi:energy-coupling factor transporter ATP-binding protein EcfA2|nr:AAA family ATPase [Polyangia bacterium]
MRITNLNIKNYRTLEDISLPFATSYAAICGRNDAGKSNIIRALRLVLREQARPFFHDDDEERISFKQDFPKWKKVPPDEDKSQPISISVSLELDSERDAGLHRFVIKQLGLTEDLQKLILTIELERGSEKSEEAVLRVRAGDRTFADLDAQEVLKRFRNAGSILFHNSTETDPPLRYAGAFRHYIGGLSDEYADLFKSSRDNLNKKLGKLARKHASEFEAFLGRLGSKYKIGLGVPSFDIGFFPISITLGHKDYDVPLDSWGSGTRNRTLILLALLRAKQVSQSATSADKVTPVLVIEEPESFLHPSAQAEFGRVLNDLADEFAVQVIVTTHSPYLLSTRTAEANHLVCRRRHYKQSLGTELIDTGGDNWFKPFGEVLGLDGGELKPWRNLMFSPRDHVLLVEGDTDRDYLELLRDERHGTKRLKFDGEILPYDGTGSLQSPVLVRFLRNRYQRLFVTFDLDSAPSIEKMLQHLGFQDGADYVAVGMAEAGKRNIEGLLPERVVKAVFAAHASTVQAATNGTKDEQKSAKGRLKKFLFEEFRANAVPGDEDFGGFYRLARKIERAFPPEKPKDEIGGGLTEE